MEFFDNVTEYSKELCKIKLLHDTKKLFSYNLDKYKINYKIKFIIILFNLPSYNTFISEKNYKLEKYYPLYEFIVNIINDIYIDPAITLQEKNNIYIILNDYLLDNLNILNKGQILLKKIYNIINDWTIIIDNKNKYIYNKYLLDCSEKGTINTFIFWLSIFKIDFLDLSNNLQSEIFINAIGNSDDRLYKYLILYILETNKIFFQNTALINNIIIKLSSSYIPIKYILKRLKFISSHISLIPYFDIMINKFNNGNIIINIHKYYYTIPYNFDNLIIIINKIHYSSLILYSFYNSLKTEEEKIMTNIILSLSTSTSNVFNITNELLFKKIMLENINKILLIIKWNNIFDNIYNNITKYIIEFLTSNNLITNFIENNINNKINYYNNKIFFLTRFMSPDNINLNINQNKLLISINYVLHKLRLLVKKKYNKTIVEKKNKIFHLLDEIKTFKPNSCIPILNNGSLLYQLNKQKFTLLPPRHLLPGEISIYKNFLLREKVDGILINNLPIGIYPKVDILNIYQLKAEYIEDLDLYLVFDIDIPNTTIIERYNILRNNHPYTQNNKIKMIEKYTDYLEMIKQDHNNINKFIQENKNKVIKWYPKCAGLYNMNKDNIYKDIIYNVIINTTEKNKLYNNDGIILSPLNGEREIKIKPLLLMTIDLLYNNNKWLDRNNNDWSYLIENTDKKKNNHIYRCYPDFKDTLKFKALEYRYDKKFPNSYYIVDNICNIIKYNWNNEIFEYESYYYENNKKIKNKNFINYINTNYKLLCDKILELNPEFNKNWLDLGCGNSKLIPLIKKYNPKYYMGIDIDIKNLIKSLKLYDNNQHIYNFNPCNLGYDWSQSKIKWSSFEKNSYDYIIANFSLMHFMTDDFWIQLNNIVHPGTKFLFNIVNNKDEWSEDNSYMKIDYTNNIVKYKFEWTHETEKIEPYISKEEIENIVLKYNWKIISYVNNNLEYKLCNLYSWWIIQKV